MLRCDLLEELLNFTNIADVVGAGAGLGTRDFVVEVKDTEKATKQLKLILKWLGFSKKTTLRTIEP
jgi:hypothetical protein